MLGQLFNRMVKTQEEIELIRKSSLLVSKTLAELASLIKIGMKPLELDKIAEDFIRANGAVPGFKGYNGFPNTLCFSVNEAVVHGIPNDRPLQETDVVSIDCGAYLNGFHGDQAFTFAMAGVNDEVMKLLQVTRESLDLAIEQAVVGKRIGDIGFAVQQYCEKEHGYGIVRELVGHGLGRELHEAPEVPNFGRRGQGTKLKENMVLAIEPMVNLGARNIVTAEDDWTIITRDGKVSAHYEHDVVVKKHQAEVLTDFSIIDEQIKQNKDLRVIAE